MERNNLIKKCFAIAVFLLFISISTIPSAGNKGLKKSTMPLYFGKILYVGGSGPGNYTRIQDAIDNASTGDTVFVYHGIYNENIIINFKDINLVGENNKNTIIDGKQNKDVMIIESSRINLRSIAIRNGSTSFPTGSSILIIHNTNDSIIEDCIFFDSFYGVKIEDSQKINLVNCCIFDNVEGIFLTNSSLCKISNCKLFNNRQRGISVLDSKYNNISDCFINGNTTGYGSGIYIDGIYNNIFGCNISNEVDGIYIDGQHNLIEECNFSNNRARGIVLNGYDNNIKKNIIANNGKLGSDDYGIEIFEGFYNIIECCQIINNSGGGVIITWMGEYNYIIKSIIKKNGYFSPYSSFGIKCYTENYIYMNNFVDNKIQAYDVESNSHWDNGEFGNYWNDYLGSDLNNDGIGDVPYELDEDSNRDYIPLIAPYSCSGPGVIITTPRKEYYPSAYNGWCFYIYLRNIKILPSPTTVIFGNIKIIANAADYNEGVDIEKVEFYVDGILRHKDFRAPYTWRWRLSSHIKHHHMISVIAYDTDGKIGIDKLSVWRFF